MVAKYCAAGLFITLFYQYIPIVVANFVTEMPNEGAVGFVHIDAQAFAFNVIGFFDVDGDMARGVAGIHLFLLGSRAP